MKRLYVVIVPTVPNAFKVSCPDVFKRIFIIPVGSRENKNIAEFLCSRVSFFFGYTRHIQRQVPFFVINLCKLFFFNRVKSAFKFHVSKNRTNSDRVKHLETEGCHA